MITASGKTQLRNRLISNKLPICNLLVLCDREFSVGIPIGRYTSHIKLALKRCSAEIAVFLSFSKVTKINSQIHNTANLNDFIRRVVGSNYLS